MDGSRPSPDTISLQDREKPASVVFSCNGPNRLRQRPGRGRGAAEAGREHPAWSLSTGEDGPQGREGRGWSWWRCCGGPVLSSCSPHQARVRPAQPRAPPPGGPCVPGAEPGPHLHSALRREPPRPAGQKGACCRPAAGVLTAQRPVRETTPSQDLSLNPKATLRFLPFLLVSSAHTYVMCSFDDILAFLTNNACVQKRVRSRG